MNELAKYVEHAEFDNKWNTKLAEFDYSTLKSDVVETLTNKEKNDIRFLVKEYNTNYKNIIKYAKENEIESYKSVFQNLDENLMLKCLIVCSNVEIVTNYVIDISYNELKRSGKSALWNVFGQQVIENIKAKASTITIPVLDKDGTEYLGEKYSLKEIEL